MRARPSTSLAALIAIASLLGPLAPLGTAEPEPPVADFVDVAAASGLDFTCEHWNKGLGLAPRWFLDIFFCTSPVLADLNGDGYTDIYFPNQRYLNASLNARFDSQDALFLNNGDGTFYEVTDLVGIHDNGYSMGAAALDHDGDGDLDLYIANYPIQRAGDESPSTIFYTNNGDGTFTRADTAAMGLVTEALFGVDDNQWGEAVAVADYDKDGDVDLYRGQYARYGLPMGMPASLQLTAPETNLFYENDGDGTFSDVTIEKGASIVPGRTFAVNFADFDGDGWPDLYVANDENPNEMYLNRADPLGGRRFVDNAIGSGANDPRGAMCSEAADFNGDGKLDLYMSHYEDENNGYYIGNGDGSFVSAETLGDLELSFHYLGWGCPSIDFDNDGDLDLFVANGHMVPMGGEFFHPGDPNDDNGYELPNFLFHNTLRETGVHSWDDVRDAAGPGLLDRLVTSGAQVADFDLDGKLEIVAVNNNDVPTSLYKNLLPSSNHWLSIELRGTTSNTFAIGAEVVVQAGALTQTAQRITGDTLASGSVEPLHFGLGAETGPATVTVTWPNGLVQTETVDVDQPVRFVEGVGVDLDTLAPRVDLTLAGSPGANGWWTSDAISVSLAAVERGIGAQGSVASLSYRLDDGPVTPYSGPFGVVGEGTHTLWTYASDTSGNAAWYVRDIRIDTTAPAVQPIEPIAGQVYVQDRIVGPSHDGGTYIIAPVRTPNEHAERVDDLIRNHIRELREHYGVDLGPAPHPAQDALAATIGSDGRVDFLVDADDATSGIDRAEFFLDGELREVVAMSPCLWRADVRGLSVGEHAVDVTVVDRAGLATVVTFEITVVPTTQDGLLNTIFGLLLDPPVPEGASVELAPPTPDAYIAAPEPPTSAHASFAMPKEGS